VALPFPLNIQASLQGDGPVDQRISVARGDRNFTFQVGSGGNNARAGASASPLADVTANLPPWAGWALLLVAAVIGWLLLRRKA